MRKIRAEANSNKNSKTIERCNRKKNQIYKQRIKKQGDFRVPSIN